MPMEPFPKALPPRRSQRRFGTLRSIMALMLREMATTYGRSPGGYIWAVIEPAAAIALMTLVFSAILRTPTLGISFPMFYASGVLPFLMYMGIQAKVSGGLTYSKPLLAYPTVTFLDSLLARFILEFMTKLLVGYIVFTGILLLYKTRVNIDFVLIAKAYLLTAGLGFGIGALNCVLMTRFAVYRQLWGVLNAPLFILSGIFFTYETIPTQYQDLLWFNPLIHITATMRAGFYSEYDPVFISTEYVIAVSLVCTALGLLLLRRYHRDLLSI